MYLGVDQSKRSTGIVLLDNDGDLKDFRLICPSMTLDGVELMQYQVKKYRDFLHKNSLDLNPPKVALIEGLSFSAIGGAKDILAGLNWGFRYETSEHYGFYLGVVPVNQWRSKVLSKEEQREARKTKDGLKKAVVDKLPLEVGNEFQDYVKLKHFKKESLYDLADAFWISRFGMECAKKTIDK